MIRSSARFHTHTHTSGRKTKIFRVVRLVQTASHMSKFGTSISPGGTISTIVQPPKTFGRPPRGSTIGRGAAGAGTAAGAIATAIAAGHGSRWEIGDSNDDMNETPTWIININ